MEENILPSESIGTRIKQYLDHQSVTTEKFSIEVGFHKTTLGKAIKKGGAMRTDIVEKFLRRFPEVNPYWLLLGEGDMVINKKLMTFQEKYLGLEDAYLSTLRDTIGKLEDHLRDKDKIITLLETGKH